MKTLVIGATGLLGQDLCKQLSGAGQLVGWARRIPEGNRDPAHLLLEALDMTDADAVRRGIERHKPDTVILTAAASDVDACEKDPAMARKINGHAVHSVGSACAAAGAFFVAVGTDYVFDGAAGKPYTEDDPTNPINAYGQSKLEGEQFALSSTANSIVVRVSGLFGAGRANFVSGAVNGFRNGTPVKVVTDQINSPSYTADVAGGMVRLLEIFNGDREAVLKGRLPRILHLANSGGASRLQVAREIARMLGADESLIEKTSWPLLNRPAKRPADTTLSVGLFEKTTGFRMRVWKEALQDFLQVLVTD